MKRSILTAVIAVLMIGGFLVAQDYVTKIYLDQGGDRQNFLSGAAINNQIGVGAALSSNGLAVTETGDGVTHLTTLTFTAFEFVVTDAAAAGAHSSRKLYDFPAGYIKAVSVLSDLDITCNTTGLTATATHEFGFGTAAAGTDNAALTTTEEDILTGVATDLSSSAISLNTQDGVDDEFDGTTTAVDLYANLVFAADDASADDTCSATGTLKIVWVNAGDY